MSAGLYGQAAGAGAATSLSSMLPSVPAPATPPSSGDSGSAAWLHMASQLAVQDYLTRIQAASRDPSQYAALQAQGLLPGYDLLAQGSKARKPSTESRSSKSSSKNIFENLKLPSDTEIVKSVNSVTSAHNKSKTVDSGAGSVSIPNIPPGLTIERKKPGRKPLDPNYHVPSTGPMIDRVEITKIPMSNGTTNHSAPLDMTKSRSVDDDTDAPLNLSMKSDTDSHDPPALTIKRKSSTEQDLLSNLSSNAKIPSDYYACK